MNIGSSAEDIGLVILLLFPALLAPLLLIGAGALLARLLRLPGAIAIFFAIGAVAALLVAGALALDQMGSSVPAIVDRRDERVDIRRAGDWRHERSVSLRYRLDGAAPLAGQPAPGESATTLSPGAAQFDRLGDGEPTELRVLPLYRSLALVRLGGASAVDSIPWIWVGAALGAPLLLWGAGRLMASRAGAIALVAIAVAAGLSVPGGRAYLTWQASEDLSARPLRATAAVSEVTRVTQVDPFPCRPGSGSRCERRDTMYDVAQPYDIVQLRFVPEGARGPVIAVDAVDASGEGLAPGDQVEIAYGLADSRAALILGESRAHHWRNAVAPAALAAVIALLIAAVVIWASRRLAQSRQRGAARAQRPTASGV